MAIGYYTDNSVSQTVMKAFAKAGHRTEHIKDFYSHRSLLSQRPYVFYGILRGCGNAIRWCNDGKVEYYYVDNGYTDAIYMDGKGHKVMEGKYRVVKNGLITPYTGEPQIKPRKQLRVLVLPPSPYTAFMNDTTPEDWSLVWKHRVEAMGDWGVIRKKDEKTPFGEQVKDYDAVIAFNSMAVMEAAKMGKAVYTTHGLVTNDHLYERCIPYYDYEDMVKFYSDKQFTLEEIAEGKWIKN
jgi:hypothetical protein